VLLNGTITLLFGVVSLRGSKQRPSALSESHSQESMYEFTKGKHVAFALLSHRDRFPTAFVSTLRTTHRE
jgi:hypothetical protein